ncbi:MAG: hypothetical protein R2857_14490 [Vampirovibrionales bacterium]
MATQQQAIEQAFNRGANQVQLNSSVLGQLAGAQQQPINLATGSLMQGLANADAIRFNAQQTQRADEVTRSWPRMPPFVEKPGPQCPGPIAAGDFANRCACPVDTGLFRRPWPTGWAGCLAIGHPEPRAGMAGVCAAAGLR